MRRLTRKAEILVTDRDFGCGSSREGAGLRGDDFGLRALIGPSFAEIFQGNCIRTASWRSRCPSR